MADEDERPSKIRKLNSGDGLEESSINVEPLNDMKPATNEPLIESPSTGEITHQSGNTNGEWKRQHIDFGEPEIPLSKNQLKKIRKKQEWEAQKEARKAYQRLKDKEKKARKAEERAELRAKIASGEIAPPPPPPQSERRFTRPVQLPITFILDCDFNDLMMSKELISLGAQMTRCYSDNRSNNYRTHFCVSSWGGVLKERFETVLSNNHKGWKGVTFVEEDFQAAAKQMDTVMRGREGGGLVGPFVPRGQEILDASENPPKAREGESYSTVNSKPQLEPSQESTDRNQQDSISTATNFTSNGFADENGVLVKEEDPSAPSIIYLTSDSPNTLDRLQPNTSYIIGGIVDKNRHKGLCFKRACERGIAHAKLPIGKYMTMQSRTVLAVNHVMEIMLKWLDTEDWGEAFLQVIPKRKEARLKTQRTESETKDGESKGEESEDDEDVPPKMELGE
ncbi:guanine-1-methyltransferase-domain-containing protein [Tricladium varicosporioides]|nr:guanine-1-methyltransferase-domain-containing protein [Hymenoscyphus varicosporioides]